MARDKGRFDEAARAAYPSLFAAAAALTDNRADAEDAVQETMLKAYAAWDTFRGESTPFTWMYRILARVAARSGTPMAEGAESPESEPAPAAGPEDAAEAADEGRAIRACLRRLPPRQQEAVTLFYLEGYSYAEVAATLDISVETVRSALARARASMREMLGRTGGAAR